MSTITYNFTMSDENVAKAIVSIGKRSKSIRKDMHSVAVSVLHNWAKSGDVSTACNRATEMLDQCDPAFAQKIVNWFGMHAGFSLVETDDGNRFGYDADKTTLSTEEYQAAKAETMFELTPDKAPAPYDLRIKAMQLIEATEKKIVKGLGEDDNVEVELLQGLKALLA